MDYYSTAITVNPDQIAEGISFTRLVDQALGEELDTHPAPN